VLSLCPLATLFAFIVDPWVDRGPYAVRRSITGRSPAQVAVPALCLSFASDVPSMDLRCGN
jgi:hypothetical protein